MIVVSDRSPLSSLFLVQQLDLLPTIFGRVIIPKQVFSELQILETEFGHDLSELKSAPWLETRQVQDVESVKRLKKVLDDGESEAIILAKELQADYLLIDEHEGRQIASAEGLRIIGVLGILVQAKSNGLVPLVKPIMDDLQNIAKFRISENLYQHILEEVGE
jgi:predicted nucleic acid-binding protein